ncbi:MAG: DEAD/DEAH box helicase [Candidatus Woesearchaeota archaeon]
MINFTPRLYQETIFATASRANTLVVLPTGMGKTNIFLMLAAHRLSLYPNSKILLIGPTRPLIDQYLKVFEENFDIDKEKLVTFTGFVAPEKRAELWKSGKIFFSTPQGLENDIISKRINLEEVSLLGVDEAHRAVGDYAYVFIASQYMKLASYPRIIAMTASPGSDIERINEVVANLYIEAIEIRTEDSPDVRPYIQDVSIKWVKVEFPQEFKEVHKYLENCFRSKLEEIKKLGYLSSSGIQSKKEILGLQASLQGEVAQGNKDYAVLKSMSYAAEALKVQHALELIETQGAGQLAKYLEEIERQSRTTKTRAVQNLVRDINFRMALVKGKELAMSQIEHPKLLKLVEIVTKNRDKKMIIFTQYRDSGQRIVSKLLENQISAKLFVGQAKKGDTGLTQKMQIEILDEFRRDEFNVLVATSVGEEGLDIPQVDTVIFYEPIPSAIRHIQRRGRTGRLEKGEVIILTTKDTRDEAYRWTAHHKEKRMYRNLEELKKKIQFKKIEKQQDRLEKFFGETKVFADYREKGSGVIRELIELGITVQLESLPSADYICSARCGIEFKTTEDFVDSLIDGRLLQQIKELKQNFEKPLLIVEGIGDIYSVRNVHPNAIRGLLATISVSYGVPIIYTKNPVDTASFIAIIARREQEDGERTYSMHADKKPSTLSEQQEYVVSSLPGVGSSLAKPLLRKFGTIKKIVNADESQLKEVEMIGQKKAEMIRKVLDTEYTDLG